MTTRGIFEEATFNRLTDLALFYHTTKKE